MSDQLYKKGNVVIKLKNENRRKVEEFLNRAFSNYQEENPCPKCGSHNVDIDLAALGDGCVAGSEWCNDCEWKIDINTFPKRGT